MIVILFGRLLVGKVQELSQEGEFCPAMFTDLDDESCMGIKCGTVTGRLYVNKFKKTGSAICVLCSSKWYTLSQSYVPRDWW